MNLFSEVVTDAVIFVFCLLIGAGVGHLHDTHPSKACHEGSSAHAQTRK